MHSDQPVSSSGQPPFDRSGLLSELETLRATCRRQRAVIDGLSEAVSALRRGAAALRAENTELRAETQRLLSGRHATAAAGDGSHDGDLVEVSIALGVEAPRIARRFVVEHLADRVTAPVLDSAQLLASELVTNSVLHSGAPTGDELIVRVYVSRDVCRLEVEDRGCDAVIAPRPPDPTRGGGMGLNLVQMLSERWGVVRAANGPTRVWAQLPCAAADG